MASYSSDHVVCDDLNEDELVTQWATYIYENMNLQCGEKGYLCWIFMDGRNVVSDSYAYYHYDGEDDELDDSEEVNEKISNLEQRATLIAEEKYAIREKVKSDQEKLRKEKIEQEEKARKRKQYEMLKKEFEQRE